jgi:hypothetical protein
LTDIGFEAVFGVDECSFDLCLRLRELDGGAFLCFVWIAKTQASFLSSRVAKHTATKSQHRNIFLPMRIEHNRVGESERNMMYSLRRLRLPSSLGWQQQHISYATLPQEKVTPARYIVCDPSAFGL